MVSIDTPLPKEFYSRFKVFHELMAIKIREILLVSSHYDAFIMEEDGRLASRIINEYRGLNLSQPPRVTRISSAWEALSLMGEKKYDLVIATPHLNDMDPFSLGSEIKKRNPSLPVILLSHSIRGIYPPPEGAVTNGIDKIFIWSGVSDLLLAIVKNAEDRLNVDVDTSKAHVRVLILVEDSPLYYSSFLPLLYKELVKQTQALLELGLNEEHRLLTMRVRPKILLAGSYEEAMELFEKYRSYLFGIIADARFPRNGRMDADAGLTLLSRIKQDIPDLPLLMMSSEPQNREKAATVPAEFLDKNDPNLLAELHSFLMNHLGFGDFVFRNPDGAEIGRASNIAALEAGVAQIPEQSLLYHAERNHFSNWIMARSEIGLGTKFRNVKVSDFSTAEELREFIISNIHTLRKWRQKGIVAQFQPNHFDPELMDFLKIGEGSLGGKGRSLAFMSALLQEQHFIYEKYPEVNISIPKTLVISTDGFEAFIGRNHLEHFSSEGFSDQEVIEAFLKADLPEWLTDKLEVYLSRVTYPLSVRSSSLLEDAQFQPYAGLYETYMIPNNHPDLSRRLQHLIRAVKLVYASTYCEAPKAFTRNTSNQPQEEAMAVIIQQVTGDLHKDFFYPAISGVAQSHNFYPIPPMKPEDGIIQVALGFGKTVVEGEKSLRFSPKYPNILPQFSTVDDILTNAQRFFYALKMKGYPEEPDFVQNSNLERREIDDAEEEFPVRSLAGTYIPEEHRIRDNGYMSGPKILTFAQVLKYNIFPLPELISDFLSLGRRGMGCPIEIEFSVNLSPDKSRKGDFFFLQMRPMVADVEHFKIQITSKDREKAICRSNQALGNGKNESISDIVFVKPEDFRVESTVQMAEEVGLMNSALVKERRPYLLIGPGRWGTADRWLGIPVRWHQISGVGAIIELRNEKLKAEQSQGSHFFQNITSLGINYITVAEDSEDYLDMAFIQSLQTVQESTYVRHVRLEKPLLIKIDGRTSQCVIIGT
ncbi:MAG: PEP/pyruvate-binding domain-containing protein [Desulfatiglandales bacterium]